MTTAHDLPDYRFEGRIGTTWSDSEPWWPRPSQPAKGAPNVVVVLFDDVGFGSFGCFGAEIIEADPQSRRNWQQFLEKHYPGQSELPEQRTNS